MRKAGIYILVGIFIIVAIGTFIYIRSNSIENKVERSLAKDILDWYYAHLSLLEKKGRYKLGDGLGEPKTDKERKEAITLRKLSKGLNDDWTFFDEEINFYHKVTYSEYIFKYQYIFENKKTSEAKIFEETYYQDLYSIIPVPLKEIVYTYNEKKGNSNVEYHRFLWEGDFEEYMQYYFGITMKKLSEYKRSQP